jgi:S1-C subfamily serine protease
LLYSKLKTVLAVAAILLLSACATTPKNNDMHLNAVRVTNTAANHGGTGIVLRSTDTESYVLTNSHVCGVVEKGGIVSGNTGTFLVSGYKKSNVHDLCLIKVSGDLGYNTKVASRPPRPYYEKASISGHPGLYPNVVSTGHFSGKDIITILTGFRPCTDAEVNNDKTAIFCALLGGIPILKQYQSTLVTATIMPGSSGSGVYNSDNELSGVAFAGSGQLGYAWTVPYEYMKNFLNKEAKTLSYTVPPNELDVFGSQSDDKKSSESYMVRLKKVCSTASREKIKELCDLADIDMLK